jgi:hypothetical protein
VIFYFFNNLVDFAARTPSDTPKACHLPPVGGGRVGVKPPATNLQTNRVIRKPDFTVMLMTNVTLQETVIFREICSISDFSGMLAENVAVLE